MTGPFIVRDVRAQILYGPLDGLDLDVVSIDISIAPHREEPLTPPPGSEWADGWWAVRDEDVDA